MATSLFKIEGLEELNAKLSKFSQNLQREAVNNAVRKAAEPVHATAKEILNQNTEHPLIKTGNLKRSLRVNLEREKFLTSAIVRTSAPHAHLVEYGHEKVTHDGKRTGKFVAPAPFMRVAFSESNQDKAFEIMKQEIDNFVSKVEL